MNSSKPISRSTVIFGHHPCPDGAAGLAMLSEKFGLSEAVTYSGLNHADHKAMQNEIQKGLHSQPENADIVFVDIIPPVAILLSLLKNTTGSVTLLDHHVTAKNEIEMESKALAPFLSSGKLTIDLDLKRSGAGIAHDYVFGKRERPLYISLVQTIDLLTATGNPDIIKEFVINPNDISTEYHKLFTKLASLTNNEQIKNHIEFYVLAMLFDIRFNALFTQHKNIFNRELLAAVKVFFHSIEAKGIASLLDASTESLFREQIAYQQEALKKAIVIPSPLKDGMDILYITADVKCGRTFDPLIAAELQKLSRPTIAMISQTTVENMTDKNWIALRAANDTVNLFGVAKTYQQAGFAANAGGHARASALQLNKDQMQKLLAPQEIKAERRGFGVK